MHTEIGIRPVRRLREIDETAKKFISQPAPVIRKQLRDNYRETIFDGGFKPFAKIHVGILTTLPPELIYVTRQVLAAMNRLVGNHDIPLLQVRYDPTLKWSEQVAEVMESMLPEPDTGDDGKGTMTQIEFAHHVANYIVDVNRVYSRRAMIEAGLDAAANDILFQVQQDDSFRGLTQKERSFILLRFHPFYSEGRALPVPAHNPQARDFLKPLFERVLDTPKSALLTRLSTRDRRRLTMSMTPWRNKLITTRGFKDRMGTWAELSLTESLNWPWDPAEHLNAIAEKGVNVVFAPGQTGFSCIPVNLYFGPLNKRDRDNRVHPVLDDPTIDWRYDSRRKTLEMVFISEYENGLQIRTNDPEAYLVDLAMKEDVIHETPTVADSFDRYPSANISLIEKDMFVTLGDEAASADEDSPNAVDVYYFADESDVAAREPKLSVRRHNAAPFLGWANCYTRPFMRGFPAFTVSKLYEIDDTAVDYFMSFLGLNRRLARLNRYAVGMSWNAYKLHHILGQTVHDLPGKIKTIYARR